MTRGGEAGEVSSGVVGLVAAGEVLGVRVDRVRQLVRAGDLAADFVEGQWFVDGESLEELRAERARWVTVKEAAVALGCTPGRVLRAVRDGDLSRRPDVTRAVPSIARADLDRLRPLLEDERRLEQARAEARGRDQAARAFAARDAPPDTEHEWWTVAHAAAAFGVGTNRVRQLVDEGRLPVTRRQGRIWIRSDHVLQVASARAFKAAQAKARSAARE